MSAIRVWCLPVTKAKALQLSDLLERKIGPTETIDRLFAILGHEELFSELQITPENEGVRPQILLCFKEMLCGPPPCYQKAWQEDAWKICEEALYQQHKMGPNTLPIR